MKPERTLNELEREPVVYFGCTWTEIKGCVLKAGVITLPLTVLAMSVLPGAAMIWLIPALLGWIGLFWLLTRRLRALRVGKPLYYEWHRHRVRKASAPYLRAGLIYQAARSHSASRYHPR